MDVCSVHHNNTFLRYSVSLLGYGFYGDVLADSERKRWIGPARYDLSGTQAACCSLKLLLQAEEIRVKLSAKTFSHTVTSRCAALQV